MTVPAADKLRPRTPAFTPRLWSDLLGACDAAADLLDAIDALHQPTVWHGQGTYCRRCPELWPCTEHRLLHPEDGGQ
jgi:hypothetical protein